MFRCGRSQGDDSDNSRQVYDVTPDVVIPAGQYITNVCLRDYTVLDEDKRF